MEYKAVEDKQKQIEEVGHDPATETLGIRFHPAKWQEKKGLRGSIYHYLFADSDLHAALITADDIYGYFTEHIRPFPDKYPYVKVS